MEILIDIEQELYEEILSRKYSKTRLEKSVAKGTPLPKHHGDLVDRNRICKAIYAAEDNLTGFGMTYDEMDIYNDGINSMWNKLQNANPIIKADTRSDSECRE